MTTTPSRVHYLEIVTPDVDAVCRMYAAASGWEFSEPVPELGNARVAELPDGTICGVRAPMHEQESPLKRTYVRVDDLAAAVRAVEELGADILLPEMEIPGRGRIAIYACGGNQHGLWQV